MWFWSVSWLTNCQVYFSFFLVNLKKIVQSQGIFGQALNFFGQALIFFVHPLISTKYVILDDKNSLILDLFQVRGFTNELSNFEHNINDRFNI